ncbi:hypothetical protein [Hespellia stercorisuis]|uniref:Iron Transport-associated domain-containing protein n=1 Tax=Hespellia stercorisuis DSM 15480 TaxID=1121950 RepID=A0A1M6I3X9_9FIRM|nr:hypothetical protein [Hespellia stercorisuis]SHJ29132.1 hypothetical protein SAMN02745243_00216 [Hespellia stercorisuis DSM 15480]
MKKLLKKLTAAVLTATVIMAMGVAAFAANGDVATHQAALYKEGTYGTDSKVESMGNGAIGETNAQENSDGTFTVTVGLVEDFKAYGITSNMREITVNGTAATMLDQDGNGKYDAFQFTESMAFPQKLTVSFTIKSSIMPISATGDLVIY